MNISNLKRKPACSTCRRWKKEYWCITCNYEAKDLVEVVRCKDCVHYDPPHVINNGERIEYSDLPQEAFGVAEHMVSSQYGVNVAGRCTVDYNNGYTEDKRVYRKETDFCSKGE